MLMFQATSARVRAGSSSQLDEVHVADGLRGAVGEACVGHVLEVDAAAVGAVEVEHAGPGAPEVPADGGQLGRRPDGVPATRLALKALAQPQQRRARAVEVGGPLDVGCRDPGDALAPLGGGARHDRLELVPADRSGRQQPGVMEAVAHDDVGESEGQRGVGAGERLEVEVRGARRLGPDRVDDDDDAGRLGQPVLVLVGRGDRGVGSPHEDAGGVDGGARVKAVLGGAVQVLQGHVARLVADRVGVHLACPERAHEAHAEAVAEQRVGPGVVGVEDRSRSRLWVSGDIRQPRRDLLERLVPGGSAPSDERSRQPRPWIQEHPVVRGGALGAQPAAADWVVAIAADVADRAVRADRDLDPARVIAVTRAGREQGAVAHRPIMARGRPPGQWTISTSQWAPCATASDTLWPSRRWSRPTSRLPTTIMSAERSRAASRIDSASWPTASM